MRIALTERDLVKAQDYTQRGLLMLRELRYRYSELLAFLFGIYAEGLGSTPRDSSLADIQLYLDEIETLGHHPDVCQFNAHALLNLSQGEAALKVALRSLKIDTSPCDQALKNTDFTDAEWFLSQRASAFKRWIEAEQILRTNDHDLRKEEEAARLHRWRARGDR